MQMHEKTKEVDILLGKNSSVSISIDKIFESVSGEKLYDYHDVSNLRRFGVDVNEDDSICTLAGEDCSMRILVIIRSLDLLDDELHCDFAKFYPKIEDILRRKTIGFVSAHDDKVIRTSELVIFAKCDTEEDNFNRNDFEKMTSQEKIKYLDDNGYRKFKLVCSERGEGNNKLKLVDAENPATIVQQNIMENLGGVLRDNSTEYVTDDQFEGKIKWGMEFHLNNPGINSCTTYTLGYNKKTNNKKIVILGQKTGFAFDVFYKKRRDSISRYNIASQRKTYYYSLFHEPTTFYLPFKGEALTDILSYCADNNIDHESLNITIVIINPEICGGFQTIIDDIRNKTTIEQYLEEQKLSKGKNCFVKFKLSDLTKANITKILERQKNSNATFENFIDDISQGSLYEITYRSKVARFLAKYLPNWLFEFLDRLFDFEKEKTGLRLTEKNNLQKSILPINNQENSIINEPSNENNSRLVNNNESLNNELPKEKNNLKAAISLVNDQNNSITNKSSNQYNIGTPLLGKQGNDNII